MSPWLIYTIIAFAGAVGGFFCCALMAIGAARYLRLSLAVANETIERERAQRRVEVGVESYRVTRFNRFLVERDLLVDYFDWLAHHRTLEIVK